MLRKITTSLRHQDWTAVVVELIVVVVGVFIGVQASNWNEQREMDQKAVVFTERLKSDLREEDWGYQYYVDYYQEVLANARIAEGALTGKAKLSDEALLIAAYRATQYNEYTRARATYDELTSTGDIGLVRDRAMRELAVHVFTSRMFNDVADEGKMSPYRIAFRMAIPSDVQETIAGHCGDRVVAVGDYKAIEHSLDYPCATGLSAQKIATAAAILRNDSRIVGLLRLRIANVETSLGNLTVFNKTMRDHLRAMAGEQP